MLKTLTRTWFQCKLAGLNKYNVETGLIEKHTFLLSEPDQTAGGVALMDWITAMLNGSDDWVSVQD